MHSLIYIAFLSLMLFVPETALTATLIMSQEAEGGMQSTWVEENRLRVQADGQDDYMLMNFDKRTLFLVQPKHQTAIDMSEIANEHPANAESRNKPVHKVIKKGVGPEFAGYATEHYAVVINGTTCLETFTSTKAATELDLYDFITGMNEMFPRPETFAFGNDPCLLAEAALHYEKIGIPLRIIKDGVEAYSVIKFEKNATVPQGGFSVPEGYTVKSYTQMLMEGTKAE